MPYLDPVSNLTIPESSAAVETEACKSGVYKELELLELFLRNNSRNSKDRQVLAFLFSSFFLLFSFFLFSNGGSSI